MIEECKYILPDGRKCRAVALRGKSLCRHHAPNRKRHAPRPYTMRQTRLLGPLLGIEDRQAVQHTLSRTIHALANNSISVYRAQVLITSLQLAAKTFP